MLAIKIVFNILFWPSFVVGCYLGIMFIIGLLFHKQKYPMAEDQGKFLILVPCHNEEAVIAATIPDAPAPTIAILSLLFIHVSHACLY